MAMAYAIPILETNAGVS